jgi:hypothetical protein
MTVDVLSLLRAHRLMCDKLATGRQVCVAVQ